VLSRECRVEDCILGLLDRGVRVVDCERGIVFCVVGVRLRSIQVVLCPPGLDVGTDPLDVLVPRTLQIVPPDGQLALLCVGRCAELVGLSLSRRPGVLDVLLKVFGGLCLCGCSAVFCLFGPLFSPSSRTIIRTSQV
jgi:hypothetical protein